MYKHTSDKLKLGISVAYLLKQNPAERTRVAIQAGAQVSTGYAAAQFQRV